MEVIGLIIRETFSPIHVIESFRTRVHHDSHSCLREPSALCTIRRTRAFQNLRELILLAGFTVVLLFLSRIHISTNPVYETYIRFKIVVLYPFIVNISPTLRRLQHIHTSNHHGQSRFSKATKKP